MTFCVNLALVAKLMVFRQAQGLFPISDSSNPSVGFTLQQALSGSLNASGAVTQRQTGCVASDEVVTVTAEQLPTGFSSAVVQCQLATQELVSQWQDIVQASTSVTLQLAVNAAFWLQSR